MSKIIKYIAIFAFLLTLLGCDDEHKAYKPPVLKGTGTMYVFQGYDGSEDNFHAALNQWLSKNEVRLISIEGINKDSLGHPCEYVVMVQYPQDRIPANPAPPDPSSTSVEH